jgi:hypothetical protein
MARDLLLTACSRAKPLLCKSSAIREICGKRPTAGTNCNPVTTFASSVLLCSLRYRLCGNHQQVCTTGQPKRRGGCGLVDGHRGSTSTSPHTPFSSARATICRFLESEGIGYAQASRYGYFYKLQLHQSVFRAKEITRRHRVHRKIIEAVPKPSDSSGPRYTQRCESGMRTRLTQTSKPNCTNPGLNC